VIKLTINGVGTSVAKGTTVLEAARFMGFPIPTLCHAEGLSPYGACRLCVVEIGKGERSRLVSSCTYPAEEGLVVRTTSARVLRSRRMILELMVATCPQSKVIQDLAASHGLNQQRFRQEDHDCILCGLCVRMCEEQMMGKAIGFFGRGKSRHIGTPFDFKSEDCRLCGGCMYVCPLCQLRCTYTAEKGLCGGCQNLPPPCVDKPDFDDQMCSLSPCVACEVDAGATREIKE
jgi:bidirectional [NiFe] hydrogenase diaphorase subunit